MADRNPTVRNRQHFSLSASDLLDCACGRWFEILADAGLPSEVLSGRRGRPCPKCGGRDRFAPLGNLAERGAVLCRKCFGAGDDPRPGDGISTLRWWFGCDAAEALKWLRSWLGLGNGDLAIARRPVEHRLVIPDPSDADSRWAELAAVWSRGMHPAWLHRAADLLSLPVEPLNRLGVGWSAEHRATTWPMRDADGRVVGVRLRCPRTARKWAVSGSCAGLFYDSSLLSLESPRRLWVVEGNTDTAALLSIGLAAVGVPSASGGCELVAGVSRAIRPIEVVIVADADGAGRESAERLADGLLPIVPSVRVIVPELGKDARAWIIAGAGRDILDATADASPVRRLSIRRCCRD